MTAKPNQKGISVGTRGRFYLTNGSEITGKLVGVEPDQMKIELLENQPPLPIPTTDVTSWEPLEESMPKTGIKKNLEAIEKQFGDKFQSAEIKLKKPDFKFPVNELSGSRKTPMATWISIKDKYEFAKKNNVLTKQKKTDIICELIRLDKKFQNSASIKRHLAYFYALSEKWEDALKYYRESIILSQDGTGWYNLAVVAQEIQKWELVCYSLNQAFRRLPATEEQEAWYFYIKLLIKSDSHRDLSQVCQTEHREIDQDEAELLLETVVYLLKARDWIEEAEEALKKSGEVSVSYLDKILNIFDKEPTKNYQKVARSFDKNISNQTNSKESQFSKVEGQSTPLASNAQTPPIGNDYSEQLYLRASAAQNEKRIGEARMLFQQAIDAGTTHPEAYVMLISMSIDQNMELQKVRSMSEKAIEAFPSHEQLYIMYGHRARRDGQYEEAIQVFRKGLKQLTNNFELQKGLAQTLVQIDTEESLQEANQICNELERRGRKIGTRWYSKFRLFARNTRAKKAYDFFDSAGMKIGIPGGQVDLPTNTADLVVDIDNQKRELKELFELFGFTGAFGSFLVRCFGSENLYKNNLQELIEYLRGKKNKLVNLQVGGSRLLNQSLVFISVSDNNDIKNLVLGIDSNEAIVPLDDGHFRNNNNETPLQTIRKQLVEYLGSRDLYTSTQPVSGRSFFGREHLLNELTDAVHRGSFIGIYGLRKIGKTSLIQHLRDERLRDDAVADVDLLRFSGEKDCDRLYHALERSLYERLSKRNQKLANLLQLGKIKLFSELSCNDIPSTFGQDLELLLNALADGKGLGINRLVIFLDELEVMLPMDGRSGLDGYVEFFSLLRGLSQERRYKGLLSSVVVAANAAISESGYWKKDGKKHDNPVYGLYEGKYLSPLSNEDCVVMIRDLGRGMSVLWDDDAISAVLDETSGHPFLTRIFCSRIAKHNSDRPLQVTTQMVQEQISLFIRDEGDKLQQITDMLDSHFPKELDSLYNIATAPELGEESSKMSDEALRHLLGYHLIVEENGEYRVTLNLLRRWIRGEFGLRDE